ncbi:MAG: magnesium/cobalt transporter CorA [Chloroflexota bacterium]|nr:magnesium/cobalt transporter CorA [Chloroflexota bacterium]
MLSITARRGEEWITDIQAHDLCKWVEGKKALLWIDVERPTEEDLALLTEQFGFHPLAMEDVRGDHQRPKVDLYEGYALLVFYAVSYDATQEGIDLHELEMFIGHNYVVTIHDGPIEELRETHARWEQNVAHMGEDMGILLYSILDTILDNYFPVLDWIAEQLDTLEGAIFSEFDTAVMKALLKLKQDLLRLRRVVGPHRDVVNMLLRGEQGILPAAALPYLQDLYDHALRIVEGVDMYREMISTVMDGFLSVQSNNINEVMQRLTIINLLFLPLAVLTGFFGMNFEMLPFDSPAILLLALMSMVALPTGLYLWLRWKGWG